MRTFGCCVAAAAALLAGVAFGEDAMELQSAAYVKMMDGDEQLEANQPELALEAYRAAREGYGRLMAEYPEHQPRVVRYRATYCDNQISLLERKTRRTGRNEATARAGEGLPDAADASTGWDNDPLGAVQRQIAELKRKLAAAEGERDRLQGESVKLRNELETARRNGADAEELRAEAEALRKTRREQDAALSEMEEMAQGAEADVAALRAEVDRLQGEVDEVGIEGEQNDYFRKQAEARAKELEGQMAQLRAENKRLKKELKKKGAEERAEVQRKAAEEARKAEAKRAAETAKQAEETRKKDEERKAVEAAEAAAQAAEAAAAEAAAAEAAAEEWTSGVRGRYPARPVPAGMEAEDFVRRLLESGDAEVALATVQAVRQDGRERELGLGALEGKALIMMGEYEGAMRLLSTFVRDNPESADVTADFGAAALGAGEYGLAREALEEALRLDRDVSAECAYNLALIYAQVAPVDLRAAKKLYKQAREGGVERDAGLEELLK